ncbi:tyrosine-type recombinase/integrase [Streptomyces sp. NRRL S-350]|uniref:tyrosine-type recombinase/integrase n=1 Tax=Streptomyces sp. NRRL S-350 TaxID=1463902 RepID=UPI000563F4E2|nr:site-specific integrase [Streptomyces sp. NRRL S-350]
MKGVYPRKNRAGEVISYQVKWRLGGTGPWQSESFTDEPGAGVFRDEVEAAGWQWPKNWVKGVGYVDPVESAAEPEEDAEQYRFETYALASIERRGGVGGKYKQQCIRELRTYAFPTFGNCDIRSAADFSKSTVAAWDLVLSKTMVWRGATQKPMSPKTLRNIHGLVSSILEEATNEEPPLRSRNPFKLVSLPRTDDSGVDADEDSDDEDRCYLTPREVEAIVGELQRPEDKLLVRLGYATGLRWGELSALTRRHIFRDPRDGKVKVRVARAWKWAPEKGYYLGTPKSKASRRVIRLPETIWRELVESGFLKLSPGALLFHNGEGDRLPYSTFYDRWIAAVDKAKRKWDASTVEFHELALLGYDSPVGMGADEDSAEMFAKFEEFLTAAALVESVGLDPDKDPGIHDLRHGHAAALITAGRSLTYVQRRLGHESIQTTSDTYGHLLPQADDDAMETVEWALSGGRGPGHRPAGSQVVADVAPVPPEQGDGRRVYAVHVDGRPLGFWDLGHAQAVAAQWEVDRGKPARVEVWSAAWWTRQVPGGLNAVRSEMPEREQVWYVGPAMYRRDGSEYVLPSAVSEPVGRFFWDWEDGFTDELGIPQAEWRPTGATTAEAWGTDRDAVLEAYGRARVEALEKCGSNPAAASAEV